MKVDLIDSMGSDLTVVNAARVSFDKESEWVLPNTTYWPGMTEEEMQYVWDRDKSLSTRDERLIRYLATHGHWSPFAHCFLQFRIKAPIFVARQLVKHQVGLSWNEISRRYVDSEPEFYTPSTWRKRAADKKQGSGGDVDDDTQYTGDLAIKQANEIALGAYRTMLQVGISPEQARMVLPLNCFTEWYWSGSLFAFARVCRERLASDAQQETREVAQGIAEHCERLFPVSWKELVHEEQ
jgi:thymidylate synthase (FAD)